MCPSEFLFDKENFLTKTMSYRDHPRFHFVIMTACREVSVIVSF